MKFNLLTRRFSSENDAKIIDLFLSSTALFKHQNLQQQKTSAKYQKLGNILMEGLSKEKSQQLGAFLFQEFQISASGRTVEQTKSLSPGSTYSARDLTFVGSSHHSALQHPFAKKEARKADLFEKHKINPVNEFKNAALLSRFLSPTGKILGGRWTGLCGASQRNIAKAIRRARTMGVIPFLKRPNLLCSE
jgi:ribosomal protein S18